MSRKNKIIISVTGIILVLVTLIGLTYAYYLTRINGNTNDKSVTVSLANLELTYSDGNGLIEATNIVPGEVIATKTFSVENTGDKKVINYTVYLDDVINTFTNKNDVKLTLTCTSSKGNKCTGTEITYPSTDTLLSINDIEVEEKHNYELKVEFIETNTDQSIDMNKELSGNIIIRDLKGTGGTLTNTKGTNSVSVENAKLLSNYRIYGNSVQETRSGKNLLNSSLWKESVTSNGLTIQYLENEDCFIINGTTSITYPYVTKYINLKVDKTKTYSLSTKYISGTIDKSGSTSTNKYTLAYFGKNDSINTYTNWKTVNLEENDTTSQNLSIDTSYITAMWFYISGGITFNNYKVKIQLEEGSTATEYEAYGATPSPEYPSEIKSVGDLVTDTNDSNYGKYKIGVKTIEKNVFDIDTAISYKASGLVVSKNEDGSLNLKGTLTSKFAYYGSMQKQYIKSGTTLITKGYFEGTTDETYIGIVLYNKNKEIIKQFNSLKNSQTGSIKLTDDVYYIGAVWRLPNSNVGDYYEINNIKIQLEEGSVATDYEPYHEETTNIYLDQPLRKIDKYTDYIDFKSGKVVRNIKELKFDGTEDWINYTATNVNQMYLENSISSTSSSCLSNIAPYGVLANSRQNYKYGCYTVTSGTGIAFQLYGWNSSLTVSQWKTWLNTNNVMADYILKETLEESISLPGIDLNKVKYINIESSTKPSSIELDYVK